LPLVRCGRIEGEELAGHRAETAVCGAHELLSSLRAAKLEERAFVLVRAEQHVDRVLAAVGERCRQILGNQIAVDDDAGAAQAPQNLVGRFGPQLRDRRGA
jgi:hypothetical protein